MAIAGRMSLLPCCKIEPSDRSQQCPVSSVNLRNLQEFGNHRQRLRITCGGKKEKIKLVKGLEKDLSLFAAMRFGIGPNSDLAGAVQESLIKEAAEVIVKQLQSVREAKDKVKRQRKQEKKKHKTKAMKMQEEDTAHESTTNSVADVPQNSTNLNKNCIDQVPTSISAAEAVARVLLQSLEDRGGQKKQQLDLTWPVCTKVNAVVSEVAKKPTESKKVEVCMGGKCKNSGGQQLLEKFHSLAAKKENVNVVGCKCLGRCKTSPNVRLSSSSTAPAICSSVRISDVDSLTAGFFESK